MKLSIFKHWIYMAVLCYHLRWAVIISGLSSPWICFDWLINRVFVYHLYKSTILVISLVWLILFNFIWKPWVFMEIHEDNMKKFLLQQGVSKRHQQHNNNIRHLQPKSQFGYNLIIKPQSNASKSPGTATNKTKFHPD